jgi:hypothetical protein
MSRLLSVFAATICLAFIGALLIAHLPAQEVKKEPAKVSNEKDVKEALRLIGELEKKLADQKDARAKEISDIERDIRILRAVLPGLEREGAKRPMSENHQKIVSFSRMLTQPVETRGLQERVKLKIALEYFADKFGGKLLMLIDKDAFLTDLGEESADPYEEEVCLPPVPQRMPMGTALRLVLGQVGKGRATFILRPDYIEITTHKYAAAAHLIRHTAVVTEFENRPLFLVLQDLADDSSIDINLDPAVGKKADALVTAGFRNGSLESALVTVTEIAGLKYVVFERSVFVTTPERAKVLRQEELERSKDRELLEKRGKAKRLESAA